MTGTQAQSADMSELDDNRLVQAFADLRAGGQEDAAARSSRPGIRTWTHDRALLPDFEARGVRICELGIPFSDPIADGPVIQASYTEALAGRDHQRQDLRPPSRTLSRRRAASWPWRPWSATPSSSATACERYLRDAAAGGLRRR